MRQLFILICLLIYPVTSSAITYEVKSAFKYNKQIFDVPLAYPRSPGNLGLSANFTKYKGMDIWYLEGQLGRNIPLVTAEIEDLKLQLGIEAQAWIALGYDDWCFPLLTEDFLLAIPLSFRYGNFSGAFAFKHISAHRGDGMNALLEETLSASERKEYEFYDDIAEDNGMDLVLDETEAYSRDFFSLCLSYDYKIRQIESRIYGHLGYAHKMVPDEIKRWFVGTGFEAVYPSNIIAPYYAQDVTYNQDTDTVDYSGQLGAIIAHEEDDVLAVRFALSVYIGSDRRGQMLGRKEKRINFGIYIQ